MSKIAVAGLVVVHLAVALWHGDAHTQLDVVLPFEKTLFVYLVILIAPIGAAALVWTRYASAGLWVLFLSMLAAFLFGAYHHYVLVSPDNIGHLPAGSAASQAQFIDSAAVLALLELATAVYAAFCLGTRYGRSRALN